MILSRILLYVSFVFVLLSLTSFGQAKPSPTPDFSGTWKLAKMTESHTAFVPNGGPTKTEIQLFVKQDSTSLRVKRETLFDNDAYSQDLLYYLDGRGESNPSDAGKFVHTTKTRLKSEKLFLDGSVYEVGSKKAYSRRKEEWKVSSDGETLTISDSLYSLDTYIGAGMTISGSSAPYQSLTYTFKRIR